MTDKTRLEKLQTDPQTPQDVIEGLQAIHEVLNGVNELLQSQEPTDEERAQLQQVLVELGAGMDDLRDAIPQP